MSFVYDQKKIDALASELMEPQRLADGGPPDVPPTSKFRKAAAAVQAARSIGDEPLEGAPTRANVPNIGEVRLGKNREAEEAARRSSAMSGVPYRPTTRFAPLDVDRATRIAREYDLMKHDPDDPLVKMAYDQMIKETNDQYEAMLQAGIEPYFIEPGNNPYRNSPYEALLDVAENRRIGVFPSVEGFGTDPNFNPQGNPLLQETGRLISGRPALANDLFRAVHDYFGHAKPGVGFRAAGEENAYQSHAGMFSPLARRALASETRGQNSYLNYGPYGETNRTAKIEDTRFADQKAGLMPRWASEAGLVINDDRRREFFDNLARNQTGLEGAISDDGKLRLVHYSTRPLERIDPEFYGRGLSRASLAERNRSYDPEFVKRSYYGIPASEKPYVPEFGLGGIRNEVLIEPELIYQAQANPEGLWIRNDPTGSERRIAEAGYTGYYSTDPKLGKVAVIFDPYDVSKSYMIPVGAVGAGAMAMSGEEELETMANGGPPRSRIAKAAAAVRQAADSDLDMSTEGVAPADIKKSFIVNPKSLIFRETEQSQANKDSLTGDSDDFDPIVVIGNDLKNLSILDGHHRASVARDRGDSLQAVRVTESEYDLLKKKGFDDTEIAYAALQRANKGYAAGNLDSQFKGSGIADNGDRAWDELLSEDDPEGMSKGGLVDKLRSAASSVKEAGNVYKAAVGNMFSPFEPVEPQLGDPNDYEFPKLRLRRPGIVNLAIGMPNMAADLRDLFGSVKDVAIGDEVPDESWRRFDIASEAQGRYEEDMDKFLRSYTGKSMDELSGPMSAVLGVSEALAQPGIISAKAVAGLPRLARYLSNLAEFATPVTVASPGAMLTGAGINAGIRALPALMEGDDLEEMERRYSQPPAARYRGEVARRREDRENKLKMIADRRAEKLNRSPATMAEGGLVYDADKINALANELMEPVRLSEGGPPPRSRIARAAAAVRGAATPPREIPDEQRVSDDDFSRIARDLGIDLDETGVLTDMPSITQYTAADRAAAGRRAASLISTQHPIKASEALGRLMEQGFRRTATTQADRTIVGDGNIGGPNFPVLGMVDPEYAGRSWGVMTQGPATTLIRQSSPETAWTTMLGSADQLRSNQLVFDDLRDAFVSSMRQGNLTPDLESRFNHNLRLILGEDANVRDPDIWSRANTFAKRGEVAKLMMGIGISPKKGGVPLGGERSGKGVIFNPSEILKRQTEPSLLHPTQGGTVPTYALGPRMFTIEDSADYRPDLHPGFPMLLKGKDLGLNVIPTPTEVYLPDWHRNFREVMGGRTPPRKAPPGRYDLASGLKGQGLPSQNLTDDYIRHLIREGFSQGGLANYRDMIRSN
jgi:hypothetical protein